MEPPPGFLVKRGVRGKPSGDLDRANSSQVRDQVGTGEPGIGGAQQLSGAGRLHVALG